MSHWRKCPITGRWVIIAPERAQRPNEFRPILDRRLVADYTKEPGAACPFCEGSEAETPGEVAALRAPGSQPDGPGWQVRVVPNKYPALTPGDAIWAPDAAPYRTQPAAGAHEVIVETPRHITQSGQLTERETAAALRVYRDRLAYHADSSKGVYALAFKNVGREAGASLSHLHGQVVVLPMTPEVVRLEIEAAAVHALRRGSCTFCDMIAHEERTAERVVRSSAGFVAICPYASRFGCEVWILPRRHEVRFELVGDSALTDLAGVMHFVLSRMESNLNPPAYNWILHNAPFDTIASEHYHWHIEILPRHTTAAGLEWGTGVHINATTPEAAASLLRIA